MKILSFPKFDIVLEDFPDLLLLVAQQVLRAVLLFPTIERMAQSPKGKFMTPLLCKLRYILYMPVYLLSFLPERAKTSIVRFALRGLKCPDEASIATSISLFSVDCIGEQIFSLAFFFLTISIFHHTALLNGRIRHCKGCDSLKMSFILKHEQISKNFLKAGWICLCPKVFFSSQVNIFTKDAGEFEIGHKPVL